MLEFLLPLFHCFQLAFPLIVYTISCAVVVFFRSVNTAVCIWKACHFFVTVTKAHFSSVFRISKHWWPKVWWIANKSPGMFFVNGNNVLWHPQGSPEDGGKPFQCPVCGLVIKRKSYWKRHMVIHTGLKSHQCPLCPFRCARKDNLKSHMKVRWYWISSSCTPTLLFTLTHSNFNQ